MSRPLDIHKIMRLLGVSTIEETYLESECKLRFRDPDSGRVWKITDRNLVEICQPCMLLREQLIVDALVLEAT